MLSSLALVAIGLVVYSYLLYPVLLMVLAELVQLRRDLRFVSGKIDARLAVRTDTANRPSVAIIFSAFNEQSQIAARVENALEQSYPSDRLVVMAGSDGSTDQTAELLAQRSGPRVVAYPFEENRGKASVLNDLVANCTADVIVFTDANVHFDQQAVARLVDRMEDPTVGAVSGELRLLSAAGDNQDSLYWRLEQVLKFFESRIGGLLGANGAIYAIRRSAWRPLPADTICDDFCIAMNVAASGLRLVYEPAAWATEETPPSIGDEYRRRIRIGIGNFQSLFRNPAYLTKTSAATVFSYVSHKLLRWFAPHLLIVGFVCSLLSLGDPTWAWLTFLQALAYGVSAGAYWASQRGHALPAPLRIAAFLFALNWAFLVASVRYLSGDFSGSWQRTRR